MTAQYLYNELGITFYTDAPINDDDIRLRQLETLMGGLEGIERVSSGRYIFDCTFSLLWEPEELIERCSEAFKSFFGIHALAMFDATRLQDRKLRLFKELATPEQQSIMDNWLGMLLNPEGSDDQTH